MYFPALLLVFFFASLVNRARPADEAHRVVKVLHVGVDHQDGAHLLVVEEVHQVAAVRPWAGHQEAVVLRGDLQVVVQHEGLPLVVRPEEGLREAPRLVVRPDEGLREARRLVVRQVLPVAADHQERLVVGHPVPPEAEAHPVPPEAEAHPVPPEAEARPVPPEAEARPVPPEAEARPVHPEAEARPVHPEAEARPDPPEAEARPDPPEAEVLQVPQV